MTMRFYSPKGKIVWIEPGCPFPETALMATLWERCRFHTMCAAMTDEIAEAIESDRVIDDELEELIGDAIEWLRVRGRGEP